MESERVLIVEDERFTSLDLRHKLERLGYSVCGEAVSGEEAFELIIARKPDLVLMDIQLQGELDGVGVTRKLIQTIENPPPVIFLTATCDTETLRRVSQITSFGYVIKPITDQALQVSLKIAINRSRLEQRLKKARQRHESILNGLGEAVIAFSEAGKVSFLNRKAGEMLGTPCEDALGGSVDDLLFLYDLNRKARIYPHQGKRGAPERSQTGILSVSGREDRIVSIAVQFVEGEEPGQVMTLLDITIQKQAMRHLQESERRYRAVVNDQMEMICRFSTDGKITFANRAFSNYVGVAASGISGLALKSSLPAEVFERFSSSLEQLSIENPTIGLQFSIGEGKFLFCLEWVLRGLFADSDELVEVQAVGRDVSVRKRMEMLEEEKAAAEAANRAKSAFISNMSHEIRTPMNGILGNADLLRRLEMPGAQRDLVSTIYTSTQDLLAIINDILDSSKIDAGEFQIRKVKFDLFQVLEEVSGLVAPQAMEKGLEFILRYPLCGYRRMSGDRGRLRQILLNLLNNAIKFTHTGHVCLKAESKLDQDVLWYRFSVLDTGIGVPESLRERIFDRFIQADSSTTREYGGTGLGLSISKQLTERLGGRIKIEGLPQKGSCFHVTLPFSTEEKWHCPETAQAVKQGMRFLFMEENPLSGRAFTEIVEYFGFSSINCPDSKRAIKMVEEEGFNCIFLPEYRHNGMNLEFLNTLRRIAGSSIALCGLVSSGYSREATALEKSYDMVLARPLRFSRFAMICNELAHHLKLDKPFPDSPEMDDGITDSGNDRFVTKLLEVDVLLVEDNPVNQKVAERMLERMGCRVSLADNGNQALLQLEEREFDIVLMDCQMPEMDGYTAASLLRDPESEHYLPHTPIIALTAHASLEEQRRTRDVGMDDYISKPVGFNLLYSKIQHWIDDYSQRAGKELLEKKERCFFTAAPLERMGGDRTLLDDLVKIFLEDYPEQMKKLREAVERENRAHSIRISHALKGGASNIGAEALFSLFRRVEQHSREGELLEASLLLPRIERAVQLFRESVAVWRNRQKN